MAARRSVAFRRFGIRAHRRGRARLLGSLLEPSTDMLAFTKFFMRLTGYPTRHHQGKACWRIGPVWLPGYCRNGRDAIL